MKAIFKVFIIVLLVNGLMSCNSQQETKSTQQPVHIVISKMHRKHTYTNWLNRYDSTVLLANMYPLGIDSALNIAKHADGILLTGGGDVFPGYFGKINDTARCGSIDHYRDSLEFALIDLAIKNKIPLIGICRGEQIINVAMGGSLIIDIPTDWDTIVKHASKDWKLQWHDITIVPNTQMAAITQKSSGLVSSSHHQAIDRLGKGLKISAYALDSIPEAIEWANPKGKSFLMATQWHPEHMDTLSPFSAPYAKLFLKEARAHKNNRSKIGF